MKTSKNSEIVRLLEERRLQGDQVFKKASDLVGIKEIINTLPNELGVWLLIEHARNKKLHKSELIQLQEISKNVGEEAVKGLQRAIAHNRLNFKEKIVFGNSAKFTDSHFTWKDICELINEDSLTYYPSVDLTIPSINVIHADTPYHHEEQKYTYKPSTLIELNNVETTIESDYLKTKNQIYLDNNSWPGALNHNYVNDSRILAISPTQVALSLENGLSVEIPEAFWLGYPLLFAWGHWMYEGMMRLEVMARHPRFGTAPILVSSRVPNNFLDFAKTIFPNVQFKTFESSTIIKATKLYVTPLRTFHAHNVYWSESGELDRLNGDPILASDFRARVTSRLGEIRKHQSVVEFPKSIFLARNLSNYRKSRVAPVLSDLAEKKNYFAIDPGSLTPVEQLSLFLNANQIMGQTGSGMYLTVLAEEGSKSLFVGSDFSHDWSGLAHAITETTNAKPGFILGSRDFIARGFSERLYHQDFELSLNAYSKLADLM